MSSFSVLFKTRFNGEKKRLKHVSVDANVCYLLGFLKELMPKLIHHRNELKHFGSVVSVFHQMFYGVHLDLDYSENLTIPLKEMAPNRSIGHRTQYQSTQASASQRMERPITCMFQIQRNTTKLSPRLLSKKC